jgi:hypothetical protein
MEIEDKMDIKENCVEVCEDYDGTLTIDGDYFLFKCPHCKVSGLVHKDETNCQIFRCGILKHNYEQINPHTPKQECDDLFEQNRIYGCGKPYMISVATKTIFPCGYI